VIRLSPEVEEALRRGRPVVALETTLVAHGFPAGEGATVAFESEHRVRAAGAVPATTGVLDGEIRAGLEPADLERFDAAARKAGPRDLAACAAQGAVGATTVGGTLAVCKAAGIRFMATGGIGGVHRGFPFPPDVSGDLAELARAETLVVSSGVKSFLDVAATAEALETLGVPLLGFRTDDVPLFYATGAGPRVSARVESADEAARIASAHWGLGCGGLVLTRPPDQSLEGIEPLVEAALEEAERRGLSGPPVTPFVLSYLHEASEGRTLAANRALVAANASLAAEVAVAYAELAR
jgi:pseudouridine-5'-phosphate glycosidase